MAKIHILGGSGSGKTTLARDLSSLLHVPHYDLDAIGLEKGKREECGLLTTGEQPALFSLALLRFRDGLGFDGLYVVHQGLRLHVLLDFVFEDAAQDGDGVGIGGVHAEVGEAASAQVLAACVGRI